MTEKIFKSALTLTLGFAICAYAESYYSEDFESYTPGESGIAIAGTGSWTGGEGDLSKIVAGSGNNYLELNTEAGTLTNTLSSAAADAINGALASGTVSFETKVKFVPSDTLTDLSGLYNSDAKFAIYALSDENTHTNALVVYHKYYDEVAEDDVPIAEVFGNNTVDPEAFTTVRVDMKNTDNGLIFSVALGENGSPLVSQYPYLVNDEGEFVEQYDGNIWMQTVNDANQAAISKLCFQGTGSVDDIAIEDVAVTPTTYTVTFENDSATYFETNVLANTVVVAPTAPTKSGYRFNGWKLSGSAYDFATPITGAITLVADWVQVWTVSFTTAHGTAPASQTVDNGTYATEPAALSEQGWTFNGWTLNGSPFVFANTAITADTALVASWTEDTPPAADWEANPAEISDGTTAAQQYPDLASSALATADAKKLTIWAKANNIDFAAVEADTTGAYVDAFLLNCTQAQVEAEAAAFVLNITFNNGVPVVTTPEGKTYNVTPVLKGKAALTDTEWTTINDTDENDANDTADFNFFKAELSL